MPFCFVSWLVWLAWLAYGLVPSLLDLFRGLFPLQITLILLFFRPTRKYTTYRWIRKFATVETGADKTEANRTGQSIKSIDQEDQILHDRHGGLSNRQTDEQDVDSRSDGGQHTVLQSITECIVHFTLPPQ